ncbi:MAG: SCO family protein [Bacteroidia bacterium]
MKRYLPILIPIGIILALIIYFVNSGQSADLYKQLPIVGNHKLDTVSLENGAIRIDTIFHSIPDFSFTNQDGTQTTQADVEGKVYVCDYFFTTCPSICPVMSKQLDRVFDAWQDNDDVMILSHTVDPDTDTPEQLKDYASKFDADPKRWIFLTGDKEALYTQARQGYLLDAAESFGGDEDFIHTQNFALIDKHRRIRGFYDGTDEKEVNQLIKDISFLLKEQ